MELHGRTAAHHNVPEQPEASSDPAITRGRYDAARSLRSGPYAVE